MANKVLSESRQILKRVLIGVATGVSGAAIIYFLGYHRHKPKPTEIEIKKNTIKVWKSFVDLQNKTHIILDTNVLRVNRALMTFGKQQRQKDSALQKFRGDDSIALVQSMADMEELAETEDIDKDLSILINTNISYQKEQLGFNRDYKQKFIGLMLDTSMKDYEKNYEISEVNKAFNSKMQTFIERVGRSIEDVSTSIAKKYQYPFSVSDFRFYPYYQSLKKGKAGLPRPVDSTE